MPRLALEDTYVDVIRKAQFGLKVDDEALAAKAGLTAEDLSAILGGKHADAPLRAIAKALRLGGESLVQLAKASWYPEVPRFREGFAAFATRFRDQWVNSYLVWDARSGLAAAFDTGTDCSELLDTLSIERLDLRYIFITHTHEDHVADLARLAEAAPKAEIWASEKEPVGHPRAQAFGDNTSFHFGSIGVTTHSTWGHSPGGTTFVVTGLTNPVAVVGDSIFSGSMGRGNISHEAAIENNLKRVLSLDRNTVLACGHGPLTTVGQERRTNPFFTTR